MKSYSIKNGCYLSPRLSSTPLINQEQKTTCHFTIKFYWVQYTYLHSMIKSISCTPSTGNISGMQAWQLQKYNYVFLYPQNLIIIKTNLKNIKEGNEAIRVSTNIKLTGSWLMQKTHSF